MPVQLSYPGVYIQEIPSGSRTLTGVATAITAFVGRASRGPVDEPVPISSFAEFERIFGGFWRDSGLGPAVSDYYLNGGSTGIVVRLAGGATDATLDVGGLPLKASGPGSWGNALQVEVTYPAAADADAIAAAQGVAPGDLFHMTVREGPRESPRLTEDFFNVTVSEGPRRVDLVMQASQLADVDGALPTARPAATAPETPYVVADAARGGDGAPLTAADYDDPNSPFEADKRACSPSSRPTCSRCCACRPRTQPATCRRICGRPRSGSAMTAGPSCWSTRGAQTH